MTFSPGATPTGIVLATNEATVSVIIRSGSNVARAKRPPMIGTVPIGLHKISPSPRKASAMATQQISSIITSLIVAPER